MGIEVYSLGWVGPASAPPYQEPPPPPPPPSTPDTCLAAAAHEKGEKARRGRDWHLLFGILWSVKHVMWCFSADL